ncbi:MAG: glycosyltransferase family 2 protein [Chitinophagales bacterium]
MTELFDIVYPNQPLEKTYEVGLVITTYNRPFYLHRTLASLRKSDLSSTVVMMIDDNSTNYLTNQLLESLTLAKTPVIKAFRKEKEGCRMYENLQFGWDFLSENFHCKYLTNLDPDVLVQPHWISALKELHELGQSKNEEILVTGFNAYQHPIIEEKETYYIKKSLGGINFFFNQNLYQKIIRAKLINLSFDFRVGDAMEENNYPILCTKPSVVQHIGRAGLWSGMKVGTFDYAIDFGDVSPLWMKVRLFYFEHSKREGKLLYKRLTVVKQFFQKMFYRLFFNRLYTANRNQDNGQQH